MDKRNSNEDTLIMWKVTDNGQFEPELQLPVHLDSSYLHDALELVSDLWPRKRGETVTLEPHQWLKLRRVLLAVPDLWMEANK